VNGPGAYTPAFFDGQQDNAARAAGVIVPWLIEWFRPARVLDIGCGTGSWLAAFRERGVEEVVGLDGAYVDRAMLRIRESCFQATDLSSPFEVGGTFDLALSLEVAEHLDDEAGCRLIEALCGAAPVVAFSAAIPMQGGTGHVNERWQSAWADRFAERGMVVFDAVRPRVWGDDRVPWWYQQNMLVYVRESAAAKSAEAFGRVGDPAMLSLVHPELLAKRNRKPLRPMPKLAVLRAWVRAARQRLGG